jgi:NhaC family Na+:H+ antiporter
LKNGYTAARLRDAMIGGVSSAMGAIFILLAVGALIGTWNMAGTIPTVVSYGIALLRPAIFYAAVALVCAVVGMVTGSSWTTAGTLGVAFIGMAPILGMSTTIAAGAIISGAYMGDKMSPLSETTILVPTLVGGVTVNEHIKGMLWTVVPSFVVAFVIFLVIGLTADPASTAIGTDQARDALGQAFNISPLNLLPLVLLIALTLWRVPPFLAIFSVAVFTGALASFTQSSVVNAFVNDPGQGAVLDGTRRSQNVGTVVSSSGNATSATFTGGGMASVAHRVAHPHAQLAAIMEALSQSTICPVVKRAHRARLIASSQPRVSAQLPPVTSTSPTSCPARCIGPSSLGAGWRRGCCRVRSRMSARSRRRWSPGTAAAHIWPACSAWRPSSTCPMPSSTF